MESKLHTYLDKTSGQSRKQDQSGGQQLLNQFGGVGLNKLKGQGPKKEGNGNTIASKRLAVQNYAKQAAERNIIKLFAAKIEKNEKRYEKQLLLRAYAMQKEAKMVFGTDSRSTARWQGVMAFLMFYTALVTPYEVAFLSTKLDGLFFVNRIIDLGFFLDIAFNFHAAYIDSHGLKVANLQLIRKHYVRTWFPIDIVSSVPYDCLGLLESSGSVTELKYLRFLRLLKLLKLLRLLKLMTIVKTQMQKLRKVLSGSQCKLLEFFGLVLFLLHWIACLWGLVPSLEAEGVPTWASQAHLRQLRDNGNSAELVIDGREDTGGLPHSERYLLALSFALQSMALTFSLDAPPANAVETMIGCLCLFVAGFLYQFTLGTVCALLQISDPVDEVGAFIMRNAVP
jgi:hypothetical protein